MSAPEYLTINELPVGTTGLYEFSFAGGYLEQAHVKLDFVTEVGARTNYPLTAGMFVSEFTLQIPPEDIPVGTVGVRIYRDTPRSEPLINFTNGARITERNLDRLAQQTIFVAAEAFDAGAFAVAEDLIGQSLTAIQEAQDALAAAESIEAGAAASAAAALASQADAAASAASALTQANTATASKDAAALSAAAALASQNAAASSATVASDSASAAATSASNAASSASAASDSATAAAGSATAAADSASTASAQATNASNSAAAAASSATNAGTSASAAAASAASVGLGSTPTNVASAATVDLTTGSPTSANIVITGTTTITGFTVAAGRLLFVRFAGSLTLTNNANIVTQSGANIVTQAGDTCLLRATAPNVVEALSYARGVPQALGDGQTWQSITGSRALGTTYTNTTGRTIFVAASVTGSTVNQSSYLAAVGGVTVIDMLVGNPAAADSGNFYFPVPAGLTYSITVNGGAGVIRSWSELR